MIKLRIYNSALASAAALAIAFTFAPLCSYAAGGVVYSRFGREAVFATDEGTPLMAAPDPSARKIAEVTRGEILWRMEQDVEESGWDKLNYSGVIVYCESDLLSDKDPEERYLVTTNEKYYESMRELHPSYDYDSDLQATDLIDLSQEEIIEVIGPLCRADMEHSGVLASVSMAQFILESAWGKSELAQEANNCFGMKADLSGNDWEGSVWDGTSIYAKGTSEQSSGGKYYSIVADFRSYPSVGDSIADHSAYLANAMAGNGLRYGGLVGCSDYEEAVRIIKDGGYATSHDYVQNICAIIERWDLTRFDS